MKNKLLSAALFGSIVISPLALADVTVKNGAWTGIITSVDVDSTGNTKVIYRRQDQEAWGDHMPYQLDDGNASFTWDPNTPDKVDFDMSVALGNAVSDTHAKVAFLNIKSSQFFYDFVQQVKGTAEWDADSRTLTHTNRPDNDDDDRRDDGRASTSTFSKPASCEKEDSRACAAFFKTSPELEGLILELTFSEDLSSFEGTVIAIQFGGSGMEEASSDINITAKGTLD